MSGIIWLFMYLTVIPFAIGSIFRSMEDSHIAGWLQVGSNIIAAVGLLVIIFFIDGTNKLAVIFLSINLGLGIVLAYTDFQLIKIKDEYSKIKKYMREKGDMWE